jgi:hypothetical protein
MSASVHIRDAVILAHSPKSCAYITYQTISSTGRRTLFERGALLPVSIAPNLECTEMGESEVIFGGMEKLEEKIREIKKAKPRAIVVVSSCPAESSGTTSTRSGCCRGGAARGHHQGDGNMAVIIFRGSDVLYLRARQIIRKDAPAVPER